MVNYFLFGTAITLFVPILRKEWTPTPFCDGCSLAGVLLLSYGGLLFLRKQQAFDGIFYIGRRIKNLLFPFLAEKIEIDLKHQKGSQKSEMKSDYSALVIGAGFLLISILLLLFI